MALKVYAEQLPQAAIEAAKEWATIYTETVRFLEMEQFEGEEQGLGFDTNKEVAALILVQLMEQVGSDK